MTRSLLLAVLLAAVPATAAPKKTPAPAATADKSKADETPKDAVDGKPVVTHHQITLHGQALRYTATAGMMPLTNEAGETQGKIFYVAYNVDNPAGPPRPLMFAFNGGPGSASVPLHMGAMGPRRVHMLPDGHMPPPPFTVEDNDDTWLDQTDLVFIDPIGTGYSRPEKPELGAKFWGVQEDLNSLADFVRLYVGRNHRWASPLLIGGESYGTTRAAGLAGNLMDKGIAVSGIVLVSAILNFGVGQFSQGGDLQYVVMLPTYTAIAWYHKKLPPDLEARPLEDVLREVEQWSRKDYAAALEAGDDLAPEDRTKAIETMARYTGLGKTFLDLNDLRVPSFRFTKELLRDQNRTLGNYDGRLTLPADRAVGDFPDEDASTANMNPPFNHVWNQYVRTELGWRTDRPYTMLNGRLFPTWNWGPGGSSSADTSGVLRDTMAKNPYLKVFVASGHYDMVTPYYATKYTLSHMGLHSELRLRISTGEYGAGHMMYTDTPSRQKLHADVSAFLKTVVPAGTGK